MVLIGFYGSYWVLCPVLIGFYVQFLLGFMSSSYWVLCPVLIGFYVQFLLGFMSSSYEILEVILSHEGIFVKRGDKISQAPT